MRLGWIRRVAVATALTLGLGLAAADGPALGVALPTVVPALGSGPTLPGTSGLPSTSNLPVDPQKLIAPTPAAPVSPALPAGATGPSGPAGPTAVPGPPTSNQASTSGVHRGTVLSTGRVRNLVNGDRVAQPGAVASHRPGVRRAAASGGRAKARRHRRGLSTDNPGFLLFHPSQLDHLGRILGQSASPSHFLGGFSTSATGNASWAPPLLAVMLLIGLGGFFRLATAPPRRGS